jgi:predicted NBD/HSP70 family sugar kinase
MCPAAEHPPAAPPGETPGAPPDPALPASRGGSQGGVRLYNERLILSLIRRHAALTKVEIARATGLSQQTTTVIINRLTEEGLLVPGERQRGRVGQPAVPYRLNPEGALSLGVLIGRRSAEVALMDLSGVIRARLRRTHQWPDPTTVVAFARQAIARITRTLPRDAARRIAGLGVAIPSGLWQWTDIVGAPPGALDGWRDLDLAVALDAAGRWPVLVGNDTTAACGAELIFGRGTRHADFAYFYLGAFVGGGIVLNGALLPGRTGNAGALGSLPVSRPRGGVQQLLRCASIWQLERRLVAAGHDAGVLWQAPADWDALGAPLAGWIDESARALAQACVAAAAVIDFQAFLIDGNFPPAVRARLVARTRQRIATIDREGLSDFAIEEGAVGRDARSIGAAAMPLLASFGRDRDVLLKDLEPAAA